MKFPASAGASVRRFVHFSTTDVYGHPGTAAIEETYASRRFSNWYAQTKLNAEREVREAEASGAFETVILRPATVYGPGSSEVVGGIARAIRDRNMLLIDGGRSDAGLCFVENLLDAALLALEHDAAPGLAFNVSDGLGVTWREFTDGLAEGLGCARVRWSVALLGRQRGRHISGARLPAAATHHGDDGAAAPRHGSRSCRSWLPAPPVRRKIFLDLRCNSR